ncbi:hypothetical protein M436DRAFT_72942 [Aureobasidium namibiae CBS 147.97]|uniref:Uncharacterized protein n=1 Tax=Aureobasidium namibiae CBS 147.97 TaxID=1043004 RepID=A0A074WI09_9PEZI|nr:uncharacterized protein M436DRAFT_72942 [Aureobasidium namibiae CBS 147.97]KEQ72750.1 hypothetical protein M436DRAFT_72942 [Aureobasidium namibiae CBS 147.97]
MDLTPIRIRGRRKRGRVFQNTDVSLTKRDRPWKTARFNQASSQPLKNKKKTKRDPTLSKFEQLPTELVQVIFQLCNNISLPLSSYVFARDLSYRHTYLRLAIDTLSKDGNNENKAADAAAVSRMLQCKWMSWDLFRDVVQEIHRRRSPPSRNSSPSDSDSDPDDSDNDDEHPPIPVPNFSHPQNQPRLPYLALSSSVQLPQSLLHEPWTTPKLDFLKYLVWSGCSIDWTSSSRGETATAGLATAISTHSHTAVAVLCCPAINVTPTTHLLKIAVMDHKCSPSVVFYLVAAALRAHIVSRASGDAAPDVNFRDPSLWHWVERVEKSGNAKGRWLKDVLRFAGDRMRVSSWDREAFEEFRRVGGREEDGVVRVDVPVVEIVDEEEADAAAT